MVTRRSAPGAGATSTAGLTTWYETLYDFGIAISNYGELVEIGERTESIDTWSDLAPDQAEWAIPGESLPEQIARRIEELIGAGASIGPGTRLPSERELAQIFGVSRLSVREAVHRLEALDLVVVRRGAGTFVARNAAHRDGDPAEPALPKSINIEELFEVRRLLEPAAAEWAALRADRRAVAQLQRLAERFEAVAVEPDRGFEQLVNSDIELHVEIARCAENVLLSRLLERLYDLNRAQLEYSLRRAGRATQTTIEHRRIVEAIAAKDAAGARDAMLAHLAAAESSIRAIVSGTADQVD
jgi:GntR family transcriptional regulator, transcriptional repressor for pyruvate dehydrogenase complex